MSSEFEERETAAQNMYKREQEEKKLKALQEQLSKVRQEADSLQRQVDEAKARK
ncbi:hypothetical protein ACIBCN_36900 [Nocardia sp. NPDC051052]|uniref:hypothetical protein n=1 Tax=Nocardia sp. NPDC051052 TaxID=3364322 RepID=UPI0037B4EC4C